MHKKLNAVMHMDPPGSRRRLGRNPIAEQQQDSSSSPTDVDSSNDAVAGGSSSISAECRRSSRKKTIKFDVRDLLNKNRKSHKIQIEARIDSNAPKVGAGQISKAEMDSKQKNFIEKSAIFRRYSISENKLLPRPPPPPGALIHTIQQCVGELEQLPLDGGELNLAAISPIARRLSRTQDILTASMIKPKQVSSLIVTKLESASTSKAAVAASTIPSRRRVVGRCAPSTSTAIQQKLQNRGRKPKSKVFAESTTESSSSSSNDSFELSNNKRMFGEKAKSKEDLDVIGCKVGLIDENSTTCIDLKENLDASAVTLPQPTILDDSMHNSTDDSFVAAQEDVFTLRNHSSDESTTGSIGNSPDGRKADEISLFGRSNSTETNSSDDSEKRRRKIRITVKRVSLTPQKSPLGSSFGQTAVPIDLLSSTNDENSNEDAIQIKRKSIKMPLKGKQVEKCATPPIILLESDTSNAASIESSVIEITSCLGIPIEEPESSPNTRRGRSCKLIEEVCPKTTTHDMNFQPVQKSTAPQNVEVSLSNRSSSRKSAPHLPIETIAASSPSTSLKDDAQSMKNIISPKENDMVRVDGDFICNDSSMSQNQKVSSISEERTEEIFQQSSEYSEEKIAPQLRSLRSAQSVQAKPQTPAVSKRQRKSNKAQAATDTPSEDDTHTQLEASDKEVLPMTLKDGQFESVQNQELSLPDEIQSPLSKGLQTPDCPQSQTSLSLRQRKDIVCETENKPLSESDKQEKVVLSKQTRSKGLNVQAKLDDPNLIEYQIGAKKSTSLSEVEEVLKTDEKTKHAVLEEDETKSERESTIDNSTDASSTDTTTSDRRRESLRLRSSVLPTKKQTSKKISKVIATSGTPDSSSEGSECKEKSPKNRGQIMSANVIDDKSKEETSSLCSESSSNSASTSSSSSSSGSSSTNSSSSSTSSSSSNSSSSSSSSSSDGRSTRSSRNTQKVSLEQHPKVKKIRSKSQINRTQSNKSDSDSSENFPKTDSIKGKYNDIKFNELEKLIDRRKSARLERSSSEPDRDTEESKSSFAIQHKSKTRSGRSRGRLERKAKEIRQKLPNKPLHQDLAASGVEVDKISTTNDTTKQETKTEAPKSETSITPRAKSKKRTRRFVPIKYSSSESGTLSDDGNDSSKISSVRLTRTRRKTISSASEFEEMPSDNLSPPDVALEYLPRKSKQVEVKPQQLTDKKDEPSEGESPSPPLPPTKDSKIEKNIIYKSKTEEESTLVARSKVLKSRKGFRNTSDISKESESDQSSKDTGSIQEAQRSEPSSPSSPGSSATEGLVDVLRQRKVTRLSLKTQGSDSRNNESQSKSKDLETSLGNKESIVETLQRGAKEQLPDKSSECKKSQLECDLKDGKDNKSAIQVLQDVSEENSLQNKDFSSTSKDVLDSIVVSQSKSPKQTKFTKLYEKSPVSLRSKQEYTEKLTEQKDEETDKPKECNYDEKAIQNRSREAQHDDKTSQICSNETVPLKADFDKSPNLRKVTPNLSSVIVSSPEINLSHEKLPEKDKHDDLLQEVVQVEENKEDDNLKTAEQARFSGTRKGTRLSLKKMETTNSNSEKSNKERSENDEKKTEAYSIPLDVLKSDQAVKSPRQRKPTRFSPKGPEEPKLDEGQQTKEDSRKKDETDVQKEPDLASPRIRKTMRLSPKSLNLKDIEVIPQEEYQSIELNVDAPTGDSQLKSDSETAMIGPLKSRILEKSLDPEPFNNSLSEALKLPETPKRKRKPTRFSPKSPDKPTIEAEQNLVGSEAIFKTLPDEKIKEVPTDQIDEVKKTEEPSNISRSPAVLPTEGLVKSPRARKGTRFAAKSPDKLQIQQEMLLTKESQSPTHVENKEENPSVLEIRDVSSSSLEETQLKEPVKLTRARKGTRVLAKSSENLQIEEELKKMLHDSQSEINVLFEKPDVNSSSSSETKQLQETIKSSRLKKETRFSLQAATTVESQTKKAPEEFEDDSTKNSRQKQKTGENESFAYVPTGTSILPTTSCNQTHSFIGNYSEQISHAHPPEQTSQKSSEDAAGSSNLALIKQPVGQEDAIKCLEIETKSKPELADLNVSVPSSPSSPPTFKPELTSKKGLKKQLQSMLDSLTPEDKVSQKDTTPRRKRKTLEQQQESIIPAQDCPITKKADEPNREVDMKVLSSDSNLSDDSIKPQEGSTQIDQKHTSRRQLDSSFIESLEKSLLRPISGKKTSKKKEKDKETIVVSSPKAPKEESKKSTTKKSQDPCEELKKPESSSPKLKKKQSKESPKTVKKHSEEQTTSKRKSMVAAKAKELEDMKTLEPDSTLSDLLKDDPMTKQSSEVLASPVVITQIPKTKAETKFFSPEKPSIQNESLPLIATVEQPVAPVVIVKEKSPDLLPDPLKDIEKFIEDGVNLLKRCYKIDADDDDSLDRDILKPDEMMTPKKCKLDESVAERKPEEGTPPHDDNSNSNSESSTITTNTSVSEVDTPNGIRRSHRIKNNSKSTKCLVGRGLVRERERFSTKDDEKTIYSIDDQKMDLAEVEAKNSKFLKDMEERLSNFRVIRENEYKCERVISKEAKRMLCDCFLTHEEEERGELGCGEDCLNRLLMIECGGDCTVRERCTNRRFNKFLYSPCRVFRTEKKGFGIMADIEILPGEFIMEYVGEVINGDEFEIRINEYSKDKNKHYYFMALRSDAVIDATAKGNISRFINHSCDPNAETQKWTVNGELRIGFFSRKSIMPGEEITFDYQYQRYGKEAQRCYCESSNCRGWIGAEPSSEEEEYEGVDEDESEETEEEEPAGAVIPVPVIPITTPPIVVVANVEEQPVVPVVTTEVPAIDVNIVPQPQPVAAPTPLVEPIPAEVTEKPKELPLKKKKEKKRLLEEKLKRREPKQFLEDPDIEDEVRFLVKCGLRNQADTLRLSRLIVRAKLLETRINLLQILRQGELPCRRLFLDYHGLRLLHGWMSEVIDTRDTEKSMEIRMELLSALECLPISNKTMLTDSKVYQTVRDWSNNKESHSPSDGSPKEANTNSSSASPTLAAPAPIIEDASSELQKLAAKLVHTWDNLPEVFRIPKRERIEQMKEHEREADRQYKVLGKGLMSGSDRNRNRERFMSKSGQKGRFNWSKDKERDRANERRKYAQNNNSSGKDGTDKSTGPLAGESHLSKEQRRELFAAKVARDEAEKRQAEERREFDIKCRFFGLDPKRMRPENMPFCVNPSTGQWYSTDKKAISTPPSYAHVQVPVKPKSTNPEDYRLPEMDLPPLWKFAISPKGKIYYYHVKIRIPQWEPPIKILPLAGQHNTVVKNSESDSSTAGINDSSEDDIDVIKGLDPVKLQAYIEKKIEDRRLQRYNRLVGEKPISPRKEEDRIYNQMEVRKYKENKEKIRKRKEEIRKRRDIIGKQGPLDSSNLSETTEVAESVAEALPIQDYLLSSEEEEILKAECNNSPLIDKIVQGDKIVDELDALHKKRSLKRALPIRDKYEHKKRKLDKNKDSSKSTKRNKDGEGSSSSSKYRKVREKFRCEIAGIIVQHLKPYRNESCFTGQILTDDDFNHLARKLTHFVMVKELKYCESIGQTLIVTESVKNKSREFIKKYMAKYGKVYVRPKNDPEFKDIPFL